MGHQRNERRPHRMRSVLAAGAVGAAISYLFDPDRGRSRRARWRDRLAAMVRRTSRRRGRLTRRLRGDAYGAWRRATHAGPAQPSMDDATVKQRVETELFGRPDVAKGKLAVNVEEGLAILRGEVATEARMKELAESALAVPGVSGVQNLLHLPGETAPNKEPAERASAAAANGGLPPVDGGLPPAG